MHKSILIKLNEIITYKIQITLFCLIFLHHLNTYSILWDLINLNPYLSNVLL